MQEGQHNSVIEDFKWSLFQIYLQEPSPLYFFSLTMLTSLKISLETREAQLDCSNILSLLNFHPLLEE